MLIRPLALYGNDVNFRTPLVDIYEENLLALQALKAGIDPENVMNLAGGFKFKFSMLRYPCILVVYALSNRYHSAYRSECCL